MQTLIIILFSRTLKRMIKDRAEQLGLNVSEYLKYIAVKDIEAAEKDKNSNRQQP